MEGEDEDEYMDEEREQELQSRGDEDWLLCKSRSNPQASYWFHTRTSTRFWHHPQYPYDKIAIIVPFRDLHSQQRRSQQLAKFIPLMTQFLQHAQMPFKLFIIEQSNDNRKFNRGKLLNVGYAIAEVEDYTCFIFHDVDLIPSLELLPFYACRPQSRRPIHIAKVWNRYNLNPNYFGGIVNFSKEQYEEINGYPNNFWGWGGEDDELMKRVKKFGYEVQAPISGSIEDMEEMSLTDKLSFLKEQEAIKCMNKTELLKEHDSTWEENGISTFRDSQHFTIEDSQYLSDHCVKYTVELAPNFHWSDQVCGEKDKQY